MNVHLLYGVRRFGDAEHEVILVDAGGISGEVINNYKFHLWQHWGLPCQQLEKNWEVSFYLNAAEPLYEAIEAVTTDLPPVADRYIIAHEWLGLPVVFSALLRESRSLQDGFLRARGGHGQAVGGGARGPRHPILQRAAAGHGAGEPDG